MNILIAALVALLFAVVVSIIVGFVRRDLAGPVGFVTFLVVFLVKLGVL